MVMVLLEMTTTWMTWIVLVEINSMASVIYLLKERSISLSDSFFPFSAAASSIDFAVQQHEHGLPNVP